MAASWRPSWLRRGHLACAYACQHRARAGASNCASLHRSNWERLICAPRRHTCHSLASSRRFPEDDTDYYCLRSPSRAHSQPDHEVRCRNRHSQREVSTLDDLKVLGELSDDFTWNVDVL